MITNSELSITSFIDEIYKNIFLITSEVPTKPLFHLPIDSQSNFKLWVGSTFAIIGRLNVKTDGI